VSTDRFPASPRRVRDLARMRAQWVGDLRSWPRHRREIRSARPDPGSDLRLFNLDLHIGPVSDIRAVVAPLGVELTDWTLSQHAEVIGRRRDPVRVCNAVTWRRISPRMVQRFLDRYGRYLERYDGFVVAYPPAFAALFLPLGKPVVVVGATRYEIPFTDDPERWSWLDDVLITADREGQACFVANNRGDRDYLRYFTGIESRYIPGLCDYTAAPYRPSTDRFAIGGRAPEVFERIRHATKGRAVPAAELFGPNAPWAARHSVRGWIHVPYNVSQMTFFEQHSAAVPMYFPSDELLGEWSREERPGVLSELSMYRVLGLDPTGLEPGNPNRFQDENTVRWWLARSDFAEGATLEGAIRFSSVEELAALLADQDDIEVSARMHAVNEIRRAEAVAGWSEVVDWIRDAAR
jgi:hypothetical protein